MEFPNLGDHCAVSVCQTLDFLPFTCKHCQSIFCQEHFKPASHNCEPYQKEIDSKNLREDELNPVDKVPCKLCKKKCTTLEIIYCNECQSNFCYEHRLQEDHSCNKLLKEKEELLAKSKKTVIVREVSQPKVRGAKNDALKLKVTLMKLKQKARGLPSVPEAERVYLYIRNKVNNDSLHEYYLCRKWSIGRCVSYLADELKIKNNNDKLEADQLVLKSSDQREDEEYFQLENTLEEFILKDQCSNGQELTICYQKRK